MAIYRDKYGKISKEIISQLIEESKQETKYEFEMLPELEKKAEIKDDDTLGYIAYKLGACYVGYPEPQEQARG